MENKKTRVLKTCGAILFWIALWQIAAMAVNVELLVPTPWRTLQTLFAMIGTGKFWTSVLTSLLRIAGGFLAAYLLGALCAVLSVRFPAFETVFAPLLRVVRAAPVASFIILALVWIKTDYLPLFISFLMVFPVVWAGVEEGIRSADRELLELCRVMQVSKKETVRGVYLPALLPALRTVSVNGVSLAWKSGVAAEVICKPKFAMGTMLADGKYALETPAVFAVTLVIVLLSLLFDSLLRHAWGKPQ